jgi:hypothetical protein
MTRCGPQLWNCRCAGRPTVRTAAEIASAHRESVRRAHWSGFADHPVPGWVIAVLLPEAWANDEKAA